MQVDAIKRVILIGIFQEIFFQGYGFKSYSSLLLVSFEWICLRTKRNIHIFTLDDKCCLKFILNTKLVFFFFISLEEFVQFYLIVDFVGSCGWSCEGRISEKIFRKFNAS